MSQLQNMQLSRKCLNFHWSILRKKNIFELGFLKLLFCLSLHLCKWCNILGDATMENEPVILPSMWHYIWAMSIAPKGHLWLRPLWHLSSTTWQLSSIRTFVRVTLRHMSAYQSVWVTNYFENISRMCNCGLIFKYLFCYLFLPPLSVLS